MFFHFDFYFFNLILHITIQVIDLIVFLFFLFSFHCYNLHDVFISQECEIQNTGDCNTVVDGYFVEVFICTVSGVIWYVTLRRILKNLQSTETDEWQVNNAILAIAEKNEKNNDSDTCCKLPDIIDCNSPKT